MLPVRITISFFFWFLARVVGYAVGEGRESHTCATPAMRRIATRRRRAPRCFFVGAWVWSIAVWGRSLGHRGVMSVFQLLRGCFRSLSSVW